MLDVTELFISAFIFAMLGYATFFLVGIDINKLIGAFGLLQIFEVVMIKALPVMFDPGGGTPSDAVENITWMITYLANNLPPMVIGDLAGYTAGIIVGVITQTVTLTEGAF